jgi:hypothetical protein
MSVVDKKKEVFGKIAAARTLADNMPTKKLTSSFQSINNNGNSISFLTDLIQSLVGYEALLDTVVETLTFSIPKVESAVKKALKTELKSVVSCGLNPTIPSWFKSTGQGVTIELKKVDFIDILRTNPDSVQGKLIYKDITPVLTDSSDFNTFLFGLVQDEGVTHTWNNTLDITFNAIGTNGNPNNTLTVKANPSYDNRTLTDLNNNYIDSLSLFDTGNIMTQIMDIIYGSLSSSINKSLKQLESEAKINTVVDKFINNNNVTNLPDDAFSFTKEENYKNQLSAKYRKQGIKKINVPSESNSVQTNETLEQSLNEINASVPLSSLSQFNDNISSANDLLSKKGSVINGLNQMSYDTIKNVKNPVDNITVKFDFVNEIIQNINKAIINKILLPNVILLFLVNQKIVYGVSSEYDDSVDFLKKNKNLINKVIKNIATEIITILLKRALKEIQVLVAAKIAKKIKEKNTLNSAQILSLTGAPKEQLNRIINSIT